MSLWIVVPVDVVGLSLLFYGGYRFVKWMTTPAREDDELG